MQYMHVHTQIDKYVKSNSENNKMKLSVYI